MGYLTVDDIAALRKKGLRRQTTDASNAEDRDPEDEHALFFTLRKKFDNARKIKAAGIMFNNSRIRARSSEHVNLLYARDGIEPSFEEGSGTAERRGYSDSAESTAQDSPTRGTSNALFRSTDDGARDDMKV